MIIYWGVIINYYLLIYIKRLAQKYKSINYMVPVAGLELLLIGKNIISQLFLKVYSWFFPDYFLIYSWFIPDYFLKISWLKKDFFSHFSRFYKNLQSFEYFWFFCFFNSRLFPSLFLTLIPDFFLVDFLVYFWRSFLVDFLTKKWTFYCSFWFYNK